MNDSQKDEWDLFATVHRSLQAGQQVVTFRQSVPFERPDDGNYGYATDEQGLEYELSSNFTDVLLTCIRDFKISYSVTSENQFCRLFQFGYNLKPLFEKEEEPGYVTIKIDLLSLDPDDPETYKIFDDIQRAFDGEDDEGDEWKRLLHDDE